jgi:hypothetical protein
LLEAKIINPIKPPSNPQGIGLCSKALNQKSEEGAKIAIGKVRKAKRKDREAATSSTLILLLFALSEILKFVVPEKLLRCLNNQSCER